MKILAVSKGISKMDKYKLMAPTEYTNMRDYVGEVIKVDKFTVHEEDDQYGGMKKVLAVKNGEEIVVSASPSLISEFDKILTIFGKVEKIEITQTETSGGYEVLSCKVPEV